MRVALFTEVFLPNVDGVVNTLCYLLDHLHQRGHEAIVFAPTGGPNNYAGARVVSLPGYPIPVYPEIKIVPPFHKREISEELDLFQPNVVHSLNPVFLGAQGIDWAKEHHVPVIASYHTDVAGFAERWGVGFLGPLIWAYTRAVHNRADLNWCPSRATMQLLENQGIQNLALWSRGVNTKLFNRDRRSAECRKILSDNHPDQPLLLYVGRVAPEKRIEWLRPVMDALPEVRLAIVGDGPARGKLEKLFAGTQTVFMGYLKGEKLAEAFASADIFTFPSANETFGNVILEAMASGLPAVAARAGGPVDFVKEGENGLFFDPESQEDFVARVTEMVRTPGLAQKLSKGASETAAERSWESVLDDVVATYVEYAH